MIVINDPTVKSLKEYLNQFEDDAKIVFIDSDYNERELVICCNFSHQQEINEVQLRGGLIRKVAEAVI